MATREETARMIKVMQHHQKGGAIERLPKDVGEWRDCAAPLWDWHYSDYRIKTQPFECFADIEGKEVRATYTYDAPQKVVGTTRIKLREVTE